MPPRYPFSRAQPGSSSSSTTTTTSGPQPTPDRAVVVSASGRSPAAQTLGTDSPSQLRIRIPSPRVNTHAPSSTNGAAGAGVNPFQQDATRYPSPNEATPKARRPSDLFRKKKSKKRSEGGGGSGPAWIQLEDQSPANSPTRPGAGGLQIPRYDARGYPARDRPPDPRRSPETPRGSQYQAISLSESADSLASDSSTRAGVGAYGGAGREGEDEAARFLSPERPGSYYATSSNGHSYDGASLYPPTSHAYPYPGSNGQPQAYAYGDGTSPYGASSASMSDTYVPSLYAQGAGANGSHVSLTSLNSGNSMTHFRKYDALGTAYSSASVTSKGGKRHLADMFSLPADPASWSYGGPEADDDFHDPDIKPNRQTRFLSAMMTVRGASNLGCLVFLFLLLVMLFCGYPLLQAYLTRDQTTLGGYNLGGVK